MKREIVVIFAGNSLAVIPADADEEALAVETLRKALQLQRDGVPCTIELGPYTFITNRMIGFYARDEQQGDVTELQRQYLKRAIGQMGDGEDWRDK